MNLPESQNLATDIGAELYEQQETRNPRRTVREIAEEQVKRMVAEGRASILTREEEKMLESFRIFKLTCKPGGVFKWQTRPDEGVVIVPADTPVLVREPQEVS